MLPLPSSPEEYLAETYIDDWEDWQHAKAKA